MVTWGGVSGYGGIGRRTRFRFWRVPPCRFKSCYPQEKYDPGLSYVRGGLGHFLQYQNTKGEDTFSIFALTPSVVRTGAPLFLRRGVLRVEKPLLVDGDPVGQALQMAEQSVRLLELLQDAVHALTGHQADLQLAFRGEDGL